MGSVIRILNSSAEHIQAQGQIDAARIAQKGKNAAETSLAESRRIIQTANNAASLSYAEDARRIQTANNDVGREVNAAQRRLQVTYNESAVQVADAKNKLRAARNEKAAIETSYMSWAQSLRNQRILDATGEKIGAASEDIGRLIDGATMKGAYDRLAYSEALGAATANAAAAGVEGGTIEQFNSTMRLREALTVEREGRDLQSNLRAGAKMRGAILKDGVMSLDTSLNFAEMDYATDVADQDYTAILDTTDYSAITPQLDYTVYTPNIDYTQYVDHKKMSGGTQLLALAAAAGATYFGGPAAGMAVADGFMALQDMKNGNGVAAQRGLDNAFQNAQTGFKTWRAGASDENGAGDAWGKGKIQALTKMGSALMSKAGASFKI